MHPRSRDSVTFMSQRNFSFSFSNHALLFSLLDNHVSMFTMVKSHFANPIKFYPIKLQQTLIVTLLNKNKIFDNGYCDIRDSSWSLWYICVALQKPLNDESYPFAWLPFVHEFRYFHVYWISLCHFCIYLDLSCLSFFFICSAIKLIH